MTPISIDVSVDHDRYIPIRAKPGDAGADLKARIPEGVIKLNPDEQRLIQTGVRVAIPPGWVGMVTPRSGMALKQRVRVGNSPGIIDAGYRAEIGVIVWNNGVNLLTIEDGDRIAQLVITPCFLGDFETVDALDNTTARGQGGFGSTGT